jgi:hypothetical protein
MTIAVGIYLFYGKTGRYAWLRVDKAAVRFLATE